MSSNTHPAQERERNTMTTATAPKDKAHTEREIADLEAAALRDLEKLQADVDEAAKVVRAAEQAVNVARQRLGDARGTRARRSLAHDRAKRQVLAK